MIAFAQRITRRGRRRAAVIATAGLLGLSVPMWVPRLLSTLPAFHVDEVRIIGTRHTPPDEIQRLAAIPEGASVWDDREPWEDRVRTHPMVREAKVRRAGFRSVEIEVVEKRPVALVATPELVPVNGGGQLLPLEPFEAKLDLPIVAGITEIDGELGANPEIRELVAAIDRLDRANAEFVSVISEVAFAADGGMRLLMLPDAEAGVVLLPLDDPVSALGRVSIALGQIADPRVARADARFMGQVVLTRAEGR